MLGQTRILIAEEDDEGKDPVRAYLSRAGFRVKDASRGKAAPELAETAHAVSR